MQKRLIGLVRTAPLPVALTIACSLLSMACGIVQWVLTARAVSLVFAAAPPGGLLAPVLGAALLLVAKCGLLWLRDLCGTWTAVVVKARLRRALVDKLFRLGPAYSVRHRTGDVASSVADGVEALKSYVGFYLPQAVVAMAGPALLIIVLLYLDPVVGVIAGVCVAALPLVRRAWSRVLGARGQDHWDAYEDFAAGILDALSGMTTLRSLGATRRYGEKLRTEAAQLYRATVADLSASLGVVALTAALVGVGTTVSVAVGAIRVSTGALEPSTLLLILFLAAECFRPQQELQNYWHEGFYGLAASHSIFALLDEDEPLVEAPDPVAPPAGRPVDLALDTVSYRYPVDSGEVAADPALTDVSLRVPAGHTVALVGRSGAGKTTVTGLLQRFFDPDTGSVSIGGQRLSDLSLFDARSLTAVVSQDVHLFATSVADNLRIAKPAATDEELRQAALRARIDETIHALPDGYATVLGERGATLSGGERQRLAIARALLADAPVLVLDEATSSVDGENETALKAAMAEASRGRTTLIIAHRMATVADADQVVVLDAGRVVEHGTPDELKQVPNGWYAGLLSASQPVIV